MIPPAIRRATAHAIEHRVKATEGRTMSDIVFSVAPANGRRTGSLSRPTTRGKELHRDTINPDKASDRERFIRGLGVADEEESPEAVGDDRATSRSNRRLPRSKRPPKSRKKSRPKRRRKTEKKRSDVDRRPSWHPTSRENPAAAIGRWPDRHFQRPPIRRHVRRRCSICRRLAQVACLRWASNGLSTMARASRS